MTHRHKPDRARSGRASLNQMFAEGASTLDVGLSIKGVGPRYAEAFERQYDGGVPVDQARPTNRYDRVS
jgi:hypothetical protein